MINYKNGIKMTINVNVNLVSIHKMKQLNSYPKQILAKMADNILNKKTMK